MSVKVFISYSHKDKELREELHDHLSNLRRQGVISAWYDGDIVPGTEWENQIYEHLEAAQIILLLISAGFMSSDFCYSREMKRAIARHEANEACIIPILLRPVEYENAPFECLQMLPSGGKPVSLWQDQDEALKDVVLGIKKAIHDLEANANSPQAKPDQVALTPDVVDKEHEQADPVPSISNIPFPRNRLFTGRDNALIQLHQAFTNGKQAIKTHFQVISGMGGIGKTQTALEYAYRYRTDYKYVLWVKAHTHELLVSDLASLATVLDLPLKDEKDQNLTVAVVKRWLQTHDGWLLILDNADDLRATIDFLPADAKGHILLTAREPASGIELRGTELQGLTPDKSALFLLRRARLIELDTPLTEVPERDLCKAQEISEMLGDLPLALAQAGAYIEKTRCGLAGYIERYRVRRTKLLQDRSGLTADHPEPVATTWSLSFDKLELATADLLRLCAFLHPDAIPEEIITEGTLELGPALQSIGEDIFALDDAIVELLRYSLVRRNQDEKTLTVHRLVQAVLRDSMEEETQHQWAERVVRAINRVFPEFSFTVQEQCKRYVSHVQTCADWIEQWQMIFPEAAQLLGKAGHYLYERAQYKEAETLLKQALQLYEQIGETQLLNVAQTLNLLAELYRQQGKYTQALPLYQQAFAIREQLLDPMHPDVAASLNNLARPYHHLAKYQEAEQLYLRALKIREQIFEAEHADLAHSLHDLARLYEDQGKYAQAKELCQRALEIRKRVLGPDHPDMAISLGTLATLYQAQGKYELVDPLYQRALDICEHVLGPEHPNTAASLNSLAVLYKAQGKYEQAAPLYQRALNICEQVLGSDHPNTATSLNNLAELYQAQGKYEQAEPLYQRALDIQKQVLGPEHPNTATSLNSLAVLYKAQGKYEQAEPLYQRALNICEQVLGPNHPDTATSLNNLAGLYQDQGKYEQAEPLYQRALNIQEQVLGPEHPNTANSLNNLAVLYQAQGKYEQAEPLYQRALNIQEQVLGSDHPNTANSLNNLALLYQAQGKYEQAEPLYQRALNIREQVLGSDHPNTATSLNNLAGLYQAQGKYRQAKQYYQGALEICQKVLGPKHPNTATCLSNLGEFYRYQSQYVQAKQYYQRALAIREQVLGPKHPDTAATLHSLARLYTQQRNYTQAEPLYKRAISIYQQVLGVEHPDTMKVLINYAMMLRAANRKSKAAEVEDRINAAKAKQTQDNL